MFLGSTEKHSAGRVIWNHKAFMAFSNYLDNRTLNTKFVWGVEFYNKGEGLLNIASPKKFWTSSGNIFVSLHQKSDINLTSVKF